MLVIQPLFTKTKALEPESMSSEVWLLAREGHAPPEHEQTCTVTSAATRDKGVGRARDLLGLRSKYVIVVGVSFR